LRTVIVMRADRGQTAAEYLGVLFFVLALILVFASTDFPGRVGHAVGRQICLTINRERDCDAPRAADRRLLGRRASARGQKAAALTPVSGERFRALGRGAWVRTSGLDRLGRPGTVEFRVAEPSARDRGGRAATPRGFARVQAWAAGRGLALRRTPLMAPELGGPIGDPANVVIAPAAFAAGSLRRWAADVDRRVARGETVFARVTPVYAGRELIPRALDVGVYDGSAKLVDRASLSVWPAEVPPGVPAG
jgi:hypothetical protein